MRLKKDEIEAIKSAIISFDPEAKVYLFGSRVNKSKKGGDIDLIVDSKRIGFKELIKIKTKLLLALGDRKVDIVFKKNTPFIRYALREAIQL